MTDSSKLAFPPIQPMSSFAVLPQIAGVLTKTTWISIFACLRGGEIWIFHAWCVKHSQPPPESPQASVKALCVCPYGICTRDKLLPSSQHRTWKQFVSCHLLFPHFLGNLFEGLKLSLANSLSWRCYLWWKGVPNHQDLQKNQSPGDVFGATTPALCVLKQL